MIDVCYNKSYLLKLLIDWISNCILLNPDKTYDVSGTTAANNHIDWIERWSAAYPKCYEYHRLRTPDLNQSVTLNQYLV